jgi:hypothetical protein
MKFFFFDISYFVTIFCVNFLRWLWISHWFLVWD